MRRRKKAEPDHAGVVESFDDFPLPQARALRVDAPAVDAARYGGALGGFWLLVPSAGFARKRI